MTNNETTTTTPSKLSRSEQSRINGAKSVGPITLVGRCRVSNNRMTHGFRSNHIALSNEDKEQYDLHLDAYLDRYKPIDKVEEDLVGLLASSMWQLMRMNSVEVALFDMTLCGIDSDIPSIFAELDQYGRLALSFKKSAGDNALELLRRYKTTAERAYHRALQALENMQRDRRPNPPAERPETEISIQTRDSHSPLPQPGSSTESNPKKLGRTEHIGECSTIPATDPNHPATATIDDPLMEPNVNGSRL